MAAAPGALPASLGRFLLDSGDALVVLDGAGRAVLVNDAARGVLRDQAPRELPAALESVFGAAGAARVRALRSAAWQTSGAGEPLPLALPDGRTVRVALHRLDAVHAVLRVHASSAAAPEPDGGDGATQRALVGMFWDSPFPASLQDEHGRLIALNDAYARFTGRRPEQLLGTDPLALQPADDRDAGSAATAEQRLLDADGRERWFRAARRTFTDDRGRTLHLSVLHDSSAEHAAREQADRSERDLDQWFDMSPLGMALYDDSGLLVRTNPAFEALLGTLPELLGEAPAFVRQLLAWEAAGPSALLAPGAAPQVREAYAPRTEGGQRRLRALVRGYDTPAGHRRYMAAVEDLSTEDERDLARLQIGALMNTAGVGVATFQDSGSGVATRPATIADEPARRAAPAAALQSIGRELVLPESLPDYERVQQALRQGQRIESRYAIRHPELGLRWLLTRVEPGQLASGKRTISVVTLDVTDQEQARSRNVQLAAELSTILESSPAGIGYLCGDVLVRCNRRFENLFGLAPGSAAGRGARELFAGLPIGPGGVEAFAAATAREAEYETELQLPRTDGSVQWLALSARGVRNPASGGIDVIAVLSDITRLKAQQAELEALALDRELMFSLSEVGIAFVREGRIQRANEALAALLQMPPDELAGLDLARLFADRGHFQRLWAEEDAALRRDGRWSGERPLRRADGTLRWVQVSKRLVHPGDPGGGIIASYVDVDARRRAEASLAQQAERTRAVLDSVLVGIVTVGRGGIEWMNRSARRMFGGSLQDFAGQPISTVATDEPEHPFRRTTWLDDLPEGEAETFECRVQARDGRAFWVAGNAVATREAGHGRQLTYALLDIERRRNAERRTAEAQASLQRLTEMAPLAILLYDARSLRVQQANAAALTMLGRDAGQVLGGTPEELLADPTLAARVRADFEQALTTPELTRHEYRVEGTGAPRWWEARLRPLASEGRPADQLLVVAADITEQRAAQQARLDAALAQRDMLVREVHHRIKNNLQGVAGLMEQIARARPEVAGVIAEVVGQVQAIAQVYGLQVGASGPLPLARVVEAIAASVQRTFGREIGVALDAAGAAAHGAPTLPEAEAIPIALTVNELLTNAFKHTRGEGPLRCELHAGETVRVVVSNPGALPAGFALGAVPGSISGLGLVRALLPRRHARFTLEQHGARVVAAVELEPPVVMRLTPAPTAATGT